MDIKSNGILLAFLVGLFMTAGQLLFKVGSKSISFESPSLLIQTMASSPIIVFAIALYAATIILWILTLQVLPISKAYPITALAFIIIPIASHFLFNETYNMFKLLGSSLIFVGIVIISLQ